MEAGFSKNQIILAGCYSVWQGLYLLQNMLADGLTVIWKL